MAIFSKQFHITGKILYTVKGFVHMMNNTRQKSWNNFQLMQEKDFMQLNCLFWV